MDKSVKGVGMDKEPTNLRMVTCMREFGSSMYQVGMECIISLSEVTTLENS